MAAKILGTGTDDNSAGTQGLHGMMNSNPQGTNDPRMSHSGAEGKTDSTGTMPPVGNVDPGGCK
jgi:hypothetical protein